MSKPCPYATIASTRAIPNWEALVAKYSAAAGRSEPPAISRERSVDLLHSVDALVRAVALGRSRRWRPQERGERFNLRGTLRASLHSGGDPVRLRRLGHPRRNPRFVIADRRKPLDDGARTEHILQFAHALVRRTHRARIFVFSTELREITRELRRSELPDLGEAWGGGTRIGATLRQFLRRFGMIAKRGYGDIRVQRRLGFRFTECPRRCRRRLRRRSAALIWVNPDAGVPGYVPATRGMRAVLPHTSALVSTTELPKLATIVRRAL